MSEPTSAPPGSAEKIRILAMRAEFGQPLWHPGDLRAAVSQPWLPMKYPPVDFEAVRAAAVLALAMRGEATAGDFDRTSTNGG